VLLNLGPLQIPAESLALDLTPSTNPVSYGVRPLSPSACRNRGRARR